MGPWSLLETQVPILSKKTRQIVEENRVQSSGQQKVLWRGKTLLRLKTNFLKFIYFCELLQIAQDAPRKKTLVEP